jgi:hypothetical protein
LLCLPYHGCYGNFKKVTQVMFFSMFNSAIFDLAMFKMAMFKMVMFKMAIFNMAMFNMAMFNMAIFDLGMKTLPKNCQNRRRGLRKQN